MAHVLLDLAASHGVRDDQGILVPLRLNQGDLGSLAGVSRETANIILQDFRQRGLVEADRRSLRLRNPDALEGLH